jgi:N-acylglucosamine 2-epimerase
MSDYKIDVSELKKQYEKWLFDDFLPFMDAHIIDHEKGGFLCEADQSGNLLSTNKNSWYNGRGIWVYSFLYNNLTQDGRHLKTAQMAADFLLRSKPSDNNLWSAEFTRDGEPISCEKGVLIGGEYVDVASQVYGDLFIAEGFAEYSKAADNQKLWELAKSIVCKCVRIYDRPDYAPSAPRVYMNSKSDVPGARLLGVWMVLLRVCTQMLRIKHDHQLQNICERCLNAVFDHHYNPRYQLFNEVLNHDFSLPQNEYRNMFYTGHAIETLWMVMDEAKRIKDDKLFDKAEMCFKFHLETAWDEEYGGFLRCLKDAERNEWILDKAGWLQEEVLIGTLLLISEKESQWAEKWFNRTLSYVKEKVSLEKYGLPLWNPWAPREGSFDFNIKRIENYHHPRHLMINLIAINKMDTKGLAVL